MVLAILLFSSSVIRSPSSAFASAESVYIESLTSPEIRARIDAGAKVAIIPTGGSEQNGAHMVIGKHNTIVRYTAGEIAKALGNALVAPVIAYVPEGRIEPPQGHMELAGTLSVRDETYAALLEDTAASLKQHGFTLICFLGDSGGNQAVQQQLADKLSARWKDSGVRVLQVSDYYANNGQDAYVASLKLPLQDPGGHASFEDTSELMALDAKAVRGKLPAYASGTYGKRLLRLKIDAATQQIRHALAP